MAGEPTSFLNEHSAEYLLVPDLIRRLSPRFETIIPSYFWLNREGGRIASECMQDARVKVVTAFARRPKVKSAGDREIVMRVNGELFAAAHTGSDLGSPVLAGVPLASHMLDFTFGAQCLWFGLSDVGAGLGSDEDVHLDAESGTRNGGSHISGPLDDTEIVAAATAARPLDWSSAVDAIRQIRRAPESSLGWWRRGGYRPFHLLIPE